MRTSRHLPRLHHRRQIHVQCQQILRRSHSYPLCQCDVRHLGTLKLESIPVHCSMNSILQASGINGSSESSAGPINSSLNRSEAAQRSAAEPSNSEVVAVKRRRLISRSDKRRILRDYDRCKKPGERGALLRKERVYSSMLTGWRKQLARADQGRASARGRGRRVRLARLARRCRARVWIPEWPDRRRIPGRQRMLNVNQLDD